MGPRSPGVPPVAPARRHQLLWLRAAAAMVDIALLCGLFIIVGLASGGTPASTLPSGTTRFAVGGVGAGTWWLRFGEVTVAGRWLA